MTSYKSTNEHITEIEVDGLKGRMLKLPAPAQYKDRSILFIYGHRATLERNLGLAMAINEYGQVAVPDLPGFGGMDSFFKVGKKPILDNYAEYLHAFIEKYYNQSKLTIFGFSLGFLIATRLLQLHPEMVKKVEFVGSIAGFVNGKDFKIPKLLFWAYKLCIVGVKRRPIAWLFRYTILQGWVLRTFYGYTYSAKSRLAGLSPSRRRQLLDVEVDLWHCNDVRTWVFTATEMFNADLTNKKINLPVWQIAPSNDQYFDATSNKQSLSKVYTDVIWMEVNLETHAPTVIATAQEAVGLIPPELRAYFAGIPR